MPAKAVLRAGIGSGPMSDAEVQLLRDIQGFIDFAIRNGLSFASAMLTLAHDVNGLARYGFDLDANRDGFLPRVTGHSRQDIDAVGEPEEPAE
jgi:hypothetical protein